MAIFFRLACDRPIDPRHGSGDRNRAAANDGKIGALDRMVGELRGQAFMGAVGLGHDEQARGVLVDPVDDAGPGYTADAG